MVIWVRAFFGLEATTGHQVLLSRGWRCRRRGLGDQVKSTQMPGHLLEGTFSTSVLVRASFISYSSRTEEVRAVNDVLLFFYWVSQLIKVLLKWLVFLNPSHFSLCFYELSPLTTHLTPNVGPFLHTSQFSNSLDMVSCNSGTNIWS